MRREMKLNEVQTLAELQTAIDYSTGGKSENLRSLELAIQLQQNQLIREQNKILELGLMRIHVVLGNIDLTIIAK